MRIDLHAHTQKCKQGDGEKRKITPEDFVKKMAEQEVKICAITNHNRFDTEEFNTIVQLDPNLTIFPGIELDINFHDERRHGVLVCSPQVVNQFASTFDNEPERNYDEFILDYEDLTSKIRTFSPQDIIIIPHFLDKDRGFTIEEKEELFQDLQNYIVILETSKLRSMGVVNDHEEHLSLIGSDVKDWDKYTKDVLPEIKFNINSFEKFFELANDPKNFVKNVLRGADSYSVGLGNDLSVEIFDDINVIFGEKGSGKTVLLRDHIYPHFNDMGKKVFLHEGKEYSRLYNEMIKDCEDSVEIDEDLLEDVAAGFSSITSYSEQKLQDIVRTYSEYRKDTSTNKKSKRIKKTSSTFSDTSTMTVDEVVRKASQRIQKINDVVMINAAMRAATDREEDRDRLNSELHLLSEEIRDRAAAKHKEIFVSKLTESFLDSLKESVRKKAQKRSKPNNIGFAKLVSQRLRRLEDNSKVATALQNIQASHVTNIGHLPVKGSVEFETSILVLTENDKHKKDSIFEKSRIVANRDIIKKIHQFTLEDFVNVNQYFDADEKTISGEAFTSDVVRKSSVIKIAGNDNYKPSEGEKAILSISGLLESYHYDCYLFDEVENGLGNKYISDYLIPRLKELRDKGKTVVVSTHNANIAINTLPSQVIYCDYPSDNVYHVGNMYSNELVGIANGATLSWEEYAIIHLEGNETMFNRRKNIYGL